MRVSQRAGRGGHITVITELLLCPSSGKNVTRNDRASPGVMLIERKKGVK